MTAHPTLEHVKKVFVELKRAWAAQKATPKGYDGDSKEVKHVIVLQGAHTLERYDSDRELPFRQESNMLYLTGCTTPSAILVAHVDVDADGEFTDEPTIKLYIPEPSLAVSMWSGPQTTIAQAASQAGLDAETEVEYMGEYGGAYDLIEDMNDKIEEDEPVQLHVLPYPGVDDEEMGPLDYPVSEVIRSFTVELEGPGMSCFTSKYLLDALQRARLTKTPIEIERIREANRITSAAHEIVMRELGRFARRRAGSSEDEDAPTAASTVARKAVESLSEWEIESEADAEAVFVAACRRAGAGQAYLPIVASGSRASTLHYVCNDKLFPPTTAEPPKTKPFAASATDSKAASPSSASARGCCGDGPDEAFDDLQHHSSAFLPQVLLIDAGCEVAGGYASDVTRTMPIGNGGKFTKEGREIYQLVLDMQKAVEFRCRAGVHWDDLHLLCHQMIAEEFLRLGIFKDATVTELLKSELTWAFLPHGLGHSMGVDVHDSLQLLKSQHLDIPRTSSYWPERLFRHLRIRRKLEANMVLTIEPGCYFSEELMAEVGVRKSKMVDVSVLERYIPVGGVRLEDDVVIKEDGCENLTTVGREVDWVEATCGGSPQKRKYEE